ncbi:MAG TPA: LysE family translocator [Ktedonobacteraceae bacterium]|jgi:threonine/homoserine/homoserine lactone efflux protein
MIPLTALPLFLLASWALNIAPGPDMLYVLARSANQGRRAGLVSALGIAGGTVIQTSLVALGLAGILAAVPLAYDIVKFVGAGYLIYLGIRALLSRQNSLTTPQVEQTVLWRVFAQGVVTNVLNPKVALFFLAFLPQFTSPAYGSVPLQIITLGMLFNLSGTLVNTIVALLAGSLGGWLKRNPRASRILNWLTGGIFIGLGVRLAFLQRQ